MTVKLDSCPTPKCLIIYVAPGCKICRVSTAFLSAFDKYLLSRDVEARVVVGRGSAKAVEEYARAFGPDTLLDLRVKVPLRGGVPNFIVSDSSGAVLRTLPGVPEIYTPPFERRIFEELADYLGLM